MFIKWSSLALLLAIGSLLMAACAPGSGGVAPMYPLQPGDGTTGGNPGYTNGTVTSSDNVVGNTVTSGEAGSTGPGSSAPGAGSSGDTNLMYPPGGSGIVTPSPNLLTYGDSTYKFEVQYPSNFTFRTMTSAQLAAISPQPANGFVVLSPMKVSSDIAAIEPPDLDIRVYPAAGVTSLDKFVPTISVPGGMLPTEPYTTDRGASGLKACTRLMVAPNCSYLFLSNGFIYQLTPSSQEGEQMAKTFQLLP